MLKITLDDSCPVAFLVGYNLSHLADDIQQMEQRLRQDAAVSYTIASALLLVSIIVLLYGSRLVKPTLFIVSTVTLTVASFTATEAAVAGAQQPPRNLDPKVACSVLMAAPPVLGLMGGLLSVWLFTLSFAILGFASGAVVSQILYSTFLHVSPPRARGPTRTRHARTRHACARAHPHAQRAAARTPPPAPPRPRPPPLAPSPTSICPRPPTSTAATPCSTSSWASSASSAPP